MFWGCRTANLLGGSHARKSPAKRTRIARPGRASPWTSELSHLGLRIYFNIGTAHSDAPEMPHLRTGDRNQRDDPRLATPRRIRWSSCTTSSTSHLPTGKTSWSPLAGAPPPRPRGRGRTQGATIGKKTSSTFHEYPYGTGRWRPRKFAPARPRVGTTTRRDGPNA